MHVGRMYWRRNLNRIERIGEAMPASGLRHELCDARSALWAHSAGIEAAFLPNDTSEKFDGKTVLCRSLFHRPANVVGWGWIGDRALRFAGCGLLIPLEARRPTGSRSSGRSLPHLSRLGDRQTAG